MKKSHHVAKIKDDTREFDRSIDRKNPMLKGGEGREKDDDDYDNNTLIIAMKLNPLY